MYAHLPLLHGPDGKKLSKRHGAASVQELREAGYLPEAVRNYIALLGWGDTESGTFFTTEELVEAFDLSRVSRSPAVFDEQKLRWMNGRYLRELPVEDLRARLVDLLGRDVPLEAVAISQEKLQTLADFWPLAGFLVERQEFDESAWEKVMASGGLDRLRAARDALAAAEPFDAAAVEAALRAVVERLGVKPKDVFQPVRVAISGTTVSPGHLRVGGGARPGRDARARRNRSGAGRAARFLGACRLNLCRPAADSGGDGRASRRMRGLSRRDLFHEL